MDKALCNIIRDNPNPRGFFFKTLGSGKPSVDDLLALLRRIKQDMGSNVAASDETRAEIDKLLKTRLEMRDAPNIVSLSVSADQKRLYTLNKKGERRAYDAKTGKSLANVHGANYEVYINDKKAFYKDDDAGLDYPLYSVRFPWLAASSRRGETLAVVDLAEGLCLFNTPLFTAEKHPIVCHTYTMVCVSGDGSTVAVGTGDRMLRIFKAGSKFAPLEFERQHAKQDKTALSHDGRHIAFLADDSNHSSRTIAIIDVATRDRTVFRSEGLAEAFNRVIFTPDGTVLVAIGPAGGVVGWSVADKKMLFQINSGVNSVVAMTFDDAGKVLYIADDKGMIRALTFPDFEFVIADDE